MLAALIAVGASARAADGVQTAIQHAYDMQCTALVAHDFPTAANIFSPSYVATDIDNATISRDDVVGRLNMLSSEYRVQNCSTKIVSVNTNADNYTVSTEQTIGGETATFPPQSVQIVSLQNDAWQQVRGDWKLASTTVSERTISVNGRVVSHDVRSNRP